ncbi:hypothetical protein [Arthrobacter oryzae]|uniref:hypothetical protein n=1 Tax=Arthrobacter oryzae TaxID=409290 RepID=UPI00278783F3|nr:hypothetical protein [Arthrobacter oryzae]MDQ0078268.1 hypothetical protein [Arthrobacter oryzae]
MTGISVLEDLPPHDLQPTPLRPGIHLRWSFPREVAFPWGGYYLFRRPRQAADPASIRMSLQNLSAGATGLTTLTGMAGSLTSDVPLVITDDFPPIGTLELDLENRQRLTFASADLASRVEVTIAFRTDAEIAVTAYLQHMPVTGAVLKGTAGDVVRHELTFDAISRVEVSGGPARLLDLRYVAVMSGILAGWTAVPGFPYPLTLPVSHPDYPANPSSVDEAAARTRGTGRVMYGTHDWSGTTFAELHKELIDLVRGGPAGPPMADRRRAVSGPAGPPAQVMPAQAPLDLVLLGTLDPGMAQMIGLYWVDRPPQSDAAFDYMIVADHRSLLGRDSVKALDYLRQNGFDDVDAFIAFDLRLDRPSPPVLPPEGARAYALPAAWQPPSSAGDDGLGAGLLWDRGAAAGGGLRPGSPVLFHVWRALASETHPPIVAPAPHDFEPVTRDRPVLVPGGIETGGVAPAYPADWPPFALYSVDGGLTEGWYAYGVSSVDLFGRHSPRGGSVPWHQWALQSQAPRPWYYRDPVAESQVHPFAVGLLDKVAPPPPATIEAFLLDPDDPLVVADAAYTAWRAGNAGVVGLRVRWVWPESLSVQAPDAREFRVYLQPGRLNALTGRTVEVTPITGTDRCTVQTDIDADRPADAYAGTRLQLGASSFDVLGSDAGTPLRLRVRRGGFQHDVAPEPRRLCTVAIPKRHPLANDFTVTTAWQNRIAVVGLAEHVTTEVSPDGSAVRRYEVFLPSTGLPATPALATSLAEPVAYGQICVSTADSRTHTADATKWTGTPWGGAQRFGNEGPAGQPATVYLVRRTPPPAPQVPPADGDAVLATPADYRGESFYSLRWLPLPNLLTHVSRALDHTLFTTDWNRPRASRLTLDPSGAPAHLAYFPSAAAEPRWDAAKRQQVAAELNALNELKSAGTEFAVALRSYRALSNDGLRVLAGLAGNEDAFIQLTIQPLDPADPATADRRGLDDPAGYLPSTALRAWTDTLDGRATNRYLYRAAYVDAANNRGPLSLASAPVRLPNVVPPRTPYVTKVLGGDRSIVLSWASNREPDLAAYRVYRSDDPARTRDVRLMALIHTIPLDATEPTDRPAAVSWTDTVPGLVNHWYRISAVDTAGNESPACAAVVGRGYDESPPDPPEWERLAWVGLDAEGVEHAWTGAASALTPVVALQWTATEAVRAVVQRRTDPDAAWRAVSAWLGPTGPHSGGGWSYRHYDDGADPATTATYRLKVESPAGNLNAAYDERPVEGV